MKQVLGPGPGLDSNRREWQQYVPVTFYPPLCPGLCHPLWVGMLGEFCEYPGVLCTHNTTCGKQPKAISPVPMKEESFSPMGFCPFLQMIMSVPWL